MNNNTEVTVAAALAQKCGAKPIVQLFRQRYADLWHLSRILGGYEACRLVERCAASLKEHGYIDGQTKIMIDQISSIFQLEENHDPEKPLLGYFAVIDPSDPLRAEIREISDLLSAAIKNSINQTKCSLKDSSAKDPA